MKNKWIALLLALFLMPQAVWAEESPITPSLELEPMLTAEQDKAYSLLDAAQAEEDVEKQIQMLLEAVELVPDDTEMLMTVIFYLDYVDAADAYAEKSEVLLWRALDLVEGYEYINALQMLAERFIISDRIDEAKALVTSAIAKQPDNEVLQVMMAMTHYYGGENEEAIALLETLVEDSPQNLEALSLRAAILAEECRYEEAISAYKQIATNFPEYLAGPQGLQATYAACGEFELATRMIDEILRMTQDDSLWYTRAKIRLYRMRDPERGLREAEALVRADPENMEGYTLLFGAATKLEDYEKAGDAADGMAELDGDFGMLLHSLNAAEQDKWAEAERLQSSVIQRAEKPSAFAYLCRAQTLLLGKDDVEGSVQALAQAFDANAGNGDRTMFLQLGDINMRKGDLQEAARAYDEAERATTDDPLPLLLLLETYLKAGRVDEMQDTLARMERRYPGWLETMYARLMVEDALENPQEAYDAFQKMKQKFPFATREFTGLEGYLLAALGDDAGVTLVREHMRLADAPDVEDYKDLALALLAIGAYDEAGEMLSQVEAMQEADESMSPSNVRKARAFLWANRALLACYTEDMEGALSALEQAVSYGFVPSVLTLGSDAKPLLDMEGAQALEAAYPSLGEEWDVSEMPAIPQVVKEKAAN